jgi:hypothetical protein
MIVPLPVGEPDDGRRVDLIVADREVRPALDTFVEGVRHSLDVLENAALARLAGAM